MKTSPGSNPKYTSLKWLTILIVPLLSLSDIVRANDRALDRFKHIDSRFNYGRAWSDSDDAAELSWSEAYFLDSYIELYNAYKDTYFLDKIVDHFDRVKANAVTYPAGSGTKGWLSPRYTIQHLVNSSFDRDAQSSTDDDIVVNGSFESSGADSVPANWTRVSGSNTTVYRTTTSGEYNDGSAGLAVKYYSDGSADNYLKQSVTFFPGRRYIVTYKAKSASTNGSNSLHTVGRVQIYNESASTVLAETPRFSDNSIMIDGWHTGSIIFEAPTTAANTLSVRLKLWEVGQPGDAVSYGYAGWAVYYDSISIKPVETITNSVRNSGFETGAAGDSTLPDKWTRGAGTSGDIYRSSSAGDKYSDTYGLVIDSDGSTALNLYQSIPYTPGRVYSVTFRAKTNGVASAAGKVSAYDQTASADLATPTTFTSTAWTKYAFLFTAPVAGHDVRLKLALNSTTPNTWIAYFDEIEVEPVVENISLNAGFETGTGGDATLPEEWTRVNATSSNAYRSNTLNEYYGGAGYGTVIKSNNSNAPVLRTRIYPIPGVTYTVRFACRSNTPSGYGRVEVLNDTTVITDAFVNFNNTNWSELSFWFTAPDTANPIYLRITQYDEYADNTFISYVDEISVTPAEPLSADSWTRGSGKSKSNAYVNLLSKSDSPSSPNPYSLDGKGLTLVDDNNSGYVKQRIRNYTASASYAVWFYSHTNNASNGCKVSVYDVTAGSELASATYTNTNWARNELRFTTPSSATNEIEVRLTQATYNNSGHKGFFDRVCVGERAPFLINDSMVVNPILKFIRAVDNDSSLSGAYGSKRTEYLDFIEDEILPKWDSDYRDSTSGVGISSGHAVYVFPDGNKGGVFAGRTLPHNEYIMTAENYTHLWKITNNTTYRDKANALFQFFRSKFTTDADGAWVWNYMDAAGTINNGFTYQYFAEDISHACLDISAAMEAYHNYTPSTFDSFSASDIAKFVNTFLDNVINDDDVSHPVVYRYVDGDGNYNRTDNYILDNQLIPDWIRLAEIEPIIWEHALTIAKNLNDDLWLPNFAALLAVYNREMVYNGDFSFKDTGDATAPAAWTRNGSPTTNITWNSDDTNDMVYQGIASLYTKSNGSSWNIAESTLRNYVANSDYELTFKAKAGSGGVQARADVYDYTGSNVLGTTNVSNTSWTAGSFTFTTPSASGRDIRVGLYPNAYNPANLLAFYDNVKVYANLWRSFAPNGGFEELDWFDSTLPKYWSRNGSNVVIETSVIYKGANSIKLTTNPSVAQKLVYEFRGYVPSASYTLTFYAKTNGSSAKAKGRVRNVTTSSDLATSSLVDTTSWTNFTVGFTAPSTYTDVVEIYLEHNDPSVASGIAYFDEVGVTKN